MHCEFVVARLNKCVCEGQFAVKSPSINQINLGFVLLSRPPGDQIFTSSIIIYNVIYFD